MRQRTGRLWGYGVCGILLFAPLAISAQVDWSDLFPDEQPAAAKPAAPPAPKPAPAAKPPPPPVELEEEAPPPPPPKPAPRKAAPPPEPEPEEAPPPPRAAPRVREEEEAPPPPRAAPPVEEEEEAPPRAAAPPKAPPQRPAPPPAVEEEAEEPPARAVAPAPVKPKPAPVAEAEEEPAPPPRKPAAPRVEEAMEEEVEVPRPPARAAKPAPAAAPAEELEMTEEAPVERATAAESLAKFGLEEGDLIDVANYQKYIELLTPGQQWAVSHGMRMAVINSVPVRPPRPYLLATEKYSSQVRLGPDGNSLLNYTAGMPFPQIDANDPDAPKKVMWNFYHNFHVIDDVGYRNFYPKTGTISEDGSLRVERAYIVDAYRKLNYTGRLYVDPKPAMDNPEGVRFKESVHPIIEPFDLKGVGFTSYRYLDPTKQDDSWLYLPQLRRVRRLSSAQRSDALLGQDTDADAFSGYNGQIAWMDFRLLGQKTIMAVLHARNAPMERQKPQDWCFEEVWEPRRVWVVEAVSKFPQYAYGKRVLFVDQEAYLIPDADSYDRAGQLWKVNMNFFAHKKQATPKSYQQFEENMVFLMGNFIVDTQLEHATTTFFPGADTGAKDMYLINSGTKGGVTEDYFTVAHLIATGK